jgi:hypothetical protein
MIMCLFALSFASFAQSNSKKNTAKVIKWQERTHLLDDYVNKDSLDRRKAIYVELIGLLGFGLSGNFDMRIEKGRNNGLGMRIGVGYAEIPDWDFLDGLLYRVYTAAASVGINYIYGKENHGFIGGIGIMPTHRVYTFKTSTTSGTDTFNFMQYYMELGYRRTPKPNENGLHFQVVWNPILIPSSLLIKSSLYHSMGISVGLAF